MTINVEETKVTHSCNGILTDFDFTFRIFSTDDVMVILTDSDGVETVLEETTHYSTVKSLENGGTVTTVETYADGYTITIILNLDLEQTADLPYGGYYGGPAFELIADRLTKIAQQIDAKTVQGSYPDAELSGTEKVFEIKDERGVSYYFKARPIKT